MIKYIMKYHTIGVYNRFYGTFQDSLSVIPGAICLVKWQPEKNEKKVKSLD